MRPPFPTGGNGLKIVVDNTANAANIALDNPAKLTATSSMAVCEKTDNPTTRPPHHGGGVQQ